MFDSAPKGRRFGRLDSRFHLQSSENEATLLTLLRVVGNFTRCCQAPDSSSYFSTGNLVFARMNLKPAALKDFVFDWELCFHLCKVYRFPNLVRLELPIKQTLSKQLDSSKIFAFLALCLHSFLLIVHNQRL